MKVLRSILLMLIFFAAFASLELSFHWYMATALPGAQTTREFYSWNAHRSLEIGHSAPVPTLVDMLLPMAVLAIAAGFSSRHVHWGFALAYAVFITGGIFALLPSYARLVPPGYWHVWPIAWGNLLGSFFLLIPASVFAVGTRASIRNELRKNGKLDGCQPGPSANHPGGKGGDK